MASIEKRMRDGHTVWRAHYRTPAGTQRNKTFTRKVDAERGQSVTHLTGVTWRDRRSSQRASASRRVTAFGGSRG